MNILFVNANLYGHINPTLGLVKKLLERDHQVSYFCSESFSEQIITMGARWIGFSSRLDLFLKEYRPTDRHPLELLKRADVFITHAGFNSVNEALYFGVPMLALLQVNDQHMVAKRLVSMQLGMTENRKELSPEILKSKIEALIMSREIRDNCRRISEKMRNVANLEQVVWKFEQYTEAWKEENRNGVKK